MIASVYREFALELAVESGKVIRSYFTHTRAPSFVPDLKNDGTIVTDADREAERLMREMIGRMFSDHGIIGELLIGDGQTTTCNGQSVTCAATTRIEGARVLATSVKSIELHQNGPAFRNLVRRCKTFRGWGDCYGYLMVATGRADVMCDPIMKEWDIAALIPVIRGAGGTITDWQGRTPNGATSIVAAATNELHRAAISLLNPV